MSKLIIITIILLALAFFILAIKIIFVKNGKFPEMGVGHNKEMRKRKIYCYKTQQKIIDKKILKQQNTNCSEDCNSYNKTNSH